jgi:hypothetical protein
VEPSSQVAQSVVVEVAVDLGRLVVALYLPTLEEQLGLALLLVLVIAEQFMPILVAGFMIHEALMATVVAVVVAVQVLQPQMLISR